MNNKTQELEYEDIVKVQGISQKGKTRVSVHGELWEVINFNESISRIALRSTKTGYVRWVDETEDTDFKVIKQ